MYRVKKEHTKGILKGLITEETTSVVLKPWLKTGKEIKSFTGGTYKVIECTKIS